VPGTGHEATAKVTALVLLDHLRQPPSRHYPSSMNQPIQEPRLDVQGPSQLVLDLIVQLVRYEIQSLSVVGYLVVEAREVKSIQDEVLVDLTEVLIAL